MSNSGWVSCISCHVNGLTDGVTWSFDTGPRVSIPLNGTFPKQGLGQRSLNWSAVRDEVEDFELNTRAVAGGIGLIQLCQRLTGPGRCEPWDVPATGVDLRRDAITEYVKTIRSRLRPRIPVTQKCRPAGISSRR